MTILTIIDRRIEINFGFVKLALVSCSLLKPKKNTCNELHVLTGNPLLLVIFFAIFMVTIVANINTPLRRPD